MRSQLHWAQSSQHPMRSLLHWAVISAPNEITASVISAPMRSLLHWAQSSQHPTRSLLQSSQHPWDHCFIEHSHLSTPQGHCFSHLSTHEITASLSTVISAPHKVIASVISAPMRPLLHWAQSSQHPTRSLLQSSQHPWDHCFIEHSHLSTPQGHCFSHLSTPRDHCFIEHSHLSTPQGHCFSHLSTHEITASLSTVISAPHEITASLTTVISALCCFAQTCQVEMRCVISISFPHCPVFMHTFWHKVICNIWITRRLKQWNYTSYRLAEL